MMPGIPILPSMTDVDPNWTTGPPGLSAHEKSGYRIESFVTSFMHTAAGPVPVLSGTWSRQDWWSTVLVRTGFGRDRYRISPGLYAVGRPTDQSAVLVTANFKLTTDHLRKTLSGIDAWILVLDTKGINVWCAAGKGTFSTAALVRQIRVSGLEAVVSHKRLIVPQLGATGVSARQVRKESGFTVVFGPVRMADIPEFLAGGQQIRPDMRTVTFTFRERMILTPVELWVAAKPAFIALAAGIVLSGFGPDIFSLTRLLPRGILVLAALISGMVAGAVLTPALLPWLPFRSFAAKGLVAGAGTALLLLYLLSSAISAPAAAAGLFVFSVTVSSYLAMNFTGATPFTSPSGVEKEMKRFIPVQVLCLIFSTAAWIWSAFQ